MKISFSPKYLVLVFLVGIAACNDSVEDVIPAGFKEIQLNPDDIYIYTDNSESSIGTRLDPLINDSIKVNVSITYGTPSSGTISFIPNEGWFYKANPGFTGVDNFNYTVCYKENCYSAPIKMYVEEPLAGADCKYELIGESVQTTKDQPLAIRIFLNDVVCPYRGSSISSPEKGTFNTYSYSGSIKNIVYVYFPPKGFVGTDRFKYKIFTDGADLEVYCNITITP